MLFKNKKLTKLKTMVKSIKGLISRCKETPADFDAANS